MKNKKKCYLLLIDIITNIVIYEPIKSLYDSRDDRGMTQAQYLSQSLSVLIK